MTRIKVSASQHLTCKRCGYKQYDVETILTFKRRYPGMPEHDIPYICGACLDNESEEEGP